MKKQEDLYRLNDLLQIYEDAVEERANIEIEKRKLDDVVVTAKNNLYNFIDTLLDNEKH
jgi:hypothetical protein